MLIKVIYQSKTELIDVEQLEKSEKKIYLILRGGNLTTKFLMRISLE